MGAYDSDVDWEPHTEAYWNPTEPIMVWSFRDAPEAFKRLSTNGGDEDWLALLPPSMADAYIPWLEVGHFDCCCVDRYPIKDGYVVVIGAHA